MSYIRAEEVLPQDVIKIIQQYVDGENIYIPRKEDNRTRWGEKTGARDRIVHRNRSIFEEYINGTEVTVLSDRYYLSDKSIRRIIREMRTYKADSRT